MGRGYIVDFSPGATICYDPAMDPSGPPQPPTPPPPPTEAPVDYGRIMELLRALMHRTGPGASLSEADLELLASDEDVPVAYAYAAAGMHPGIRFVREHEIAFGVCTGKCQMWGGFHLVDALRERAAARSAAGEPSFDVIPQGCLNLCDYPPAVVVATPDGVAGLPRCTVEDLDEALTMVMEEEPEADAG